MLADRQRHVEIGTRTFRNRHEFVPGGCPRRGQHSRILDPRGGNFVVEGHDTGIGMPNYSLSIVAGDEAKELNVFLRTYPVDTDETDSDAFVAALKNKALKNEQTT